MKVVAKPHVDLHERNVTQENSTKRTSLVNEVPAVTGNVAGNDGLTMYNEGTKETSY